MRTLARPRICTNTQKHMTESKRDFLTDLFFHYTDKELQENYLKFVELVKDTWPTLPPQVVDTMKKAATCRRSIHLMMLAVLVMEEDVGQENGLVKHAIQNAVPLWRLMFFRRMARIMLDLYMRPQQAGDCRVPDPTDLVPTLWSAYTKFMDKGTEWRDFYAAEEAKKLAQATTMMRMGKHQH